MNMRRALIAGATALAVAAAGSGSPAEATITSCGRIKGTHYSFRVIAHGENAPSCRTARRVARRAVGSQIDRPLRVRGWSCTADYYYEGPWSFLCIRRRTYGQVSIDHFRRLPDRRLTLASDIFDVGRWIDTAKRTSAAIDQRIVNAVRCQDGQVVERLWSFSK